MGCALINPGNQGRKVLLSSPIKTDYDIFEVSENAGRLKYACTNID